MALWGYSQPAAPSTLAETEVSSAVEAAEDVICDRCTGREPKRIIGDKAYESDELDRRIKAYGIELNSSNWSKVQDSRHRCRYGVDGKWNGFLPGSASSATYSYSPGGLLGQLPRSAAARLRRHPASGFLRCALLPVTATSSRAPLSLLVS